MQLEFVFNQVVMEYKEKAVEFKTTIEYFKPLVFNETRNGLNVSYKILDENLNLLKLLECTLWETLYLKGENPENAYDLITLVKEHYTNDRELSALVKFLVKTKNHTHYTEVDHNAVDEFNRELKFACQKYLLELLSVIKHSIEPPKVEDDPILKLINQTRFK